MKYNTYEIIDALKMSLIFNNDNNILSTLFIIIISIIINQISFDNLYYNIIHRLFKYKISKVEEYVFRATDTVVYCWK